MAETFLSGSNPVLTRELRASLRNVRAFGLIALYVALLGAVVTASFPGDQSIDLQSDGGLRGQKLFWTLVWGQVFLILVILPALSTGALAQERERQTLQPLLLTPMSPLQIVWGKAGGVLSLVGLLLLSTLPLTSLCFLLGGISPGQLVCAYSGILGLAVFTTGFGLYCSARWPSATRSLIACYTLLPLSAVLVVVASPLGIIFSGLFCLFLLAYALVQGLQKKGDAPLARKMGRFYGKAIYVVVPLAILGLLYLMMVNRSVAWAVIGVGFLLSYLVLVTQWGLLQTARELMVRADPEASLRQKVEDFKQDWQNVVTAPSPYATVSPAGTSSFGATPTYLPGQHTDANAAASGLAPAVAATAGNDAPGWESLEVTRPAPAHAAVAPPADAPAPPVKRKNVDTYGKVPFLSDTLNPIFARELRSGLLGKFEYLFRFGYIITIISQLILLAYLVYGIYNPQAAARENEILGQFVFWGRIHLGVLMIFGAWFGARAIAPEREGQTLSQLFTIPLPARDIIYGKMLAVIVFTLYVWILAVPMALMLPILDLVPWWTALNFVLVEAVMGVFAAAWGVACSFQSSSVRRALATSLGGAAAVLLAHALVLPIWELLRTLKIVYDMKGAEVMIAFFPVPLVFPQNSDSLTALITGAQSVTQRLEPVALGLYVLASLGLFVWTARDFGRLARER